MKQIMLIIGLVIASFTVKAQKGDDVPDNLDAAFTSKYPNVDYNNVEWDKDKNDYNARFMMDQKDYKVIFDRSGNWKNSEIDSKSLRDLPQPVQDGFNRSEYKNWRIHDIQTIERPDKTTYKIEVKNGRKMHKAYFDALGNMVK